MKVLISIVIGLLVVGCGNDGQQERELTEEEKKLVGEYEHEHQGPQSLISVTMKLILMGNGLGWCYSDASKNWDAETLIERDKKVNVGKWKLLGDEIHLINGETISVFRKTDEGVALVASIHDGNRRDESKNRFWTLTSTTKLTEETKDSEPSKVVPDKLIANRAVEREIRRALKTPPNTRAGMEPALTKADLLKDITEADLKKVTKLNLNGHLAVHQFSSVKGLEKLSNLKVLLLDGNGLTEVPKEIEGLTQLTNLYLWRNKLTRVNNLENLTQLTNLDLRENNLTNLEGLEKLTQLTNLKLGSNQLSDLKGLEKLVKLTNLDLEWNQLASVKKLENITQLTQLDLTINQLTDVKGLEKLTKLTVLKLGANQLSDVKSLEKLTQLKSLKLNENKLTDVKGLEKLSNLEHLDLRLNPNLIKAQIDKLQKALPKCRIWHDFR